MEEQAKSVDLIKKNISVIPETMVKVILNPMGFFKEMPKIGGFIDPLIFIVVMGVAAGFVRAIFGIFGLGLVGSFFMALASIIIVPILVGIFGFVGAAIIFIIWKIMGSTESYETAYRCIAYAAAIFPITVILGIIPYIGTVLGFIWMTCLFAFASIVVHSVRLKIAWIVFGSICAIFSIISISSEYKVRRFASQMSTLTKELEQKMEDLENMAPDEAGKAVRDFLKGLEQEAEKE